MIRAEDTVAEAIGHTQGCAEPLFETYWSARRPSVPMTGMPARSKSPDSMTAEHPSDEGHTGTAKMPPWMKLRRYVAPRPASHLSATYWMESCRPQTPPPALTAFFTASMAYWTSPRNDEPGPLFTTVVAILIWSAETPWSVDPPFCPAEQLSPAGVVEVPPPAPFDVVVV